MKKNNKGFTLMEMLIVVAIIGVLVAIAIPTVTANLDKSKQAADNANARSAYAEATAQYLLTNSAYTAYCGPMQADCNEKTAKIGDLEPVTEESAVKANETFQAWKKGNYLKIAIDGTGSCKITAVTSKPTGSGGGSK